MTPRQVLELTASYYDAPRDTDELLDLLDLDRCARTPWRRLSGGEQQRTLLALALLGRPRVLVLDEPTTAVDPEGRQVIRDLIASERDRGCALLVTTHELTEAERHVRSPRHHEPRSRRHPRNARRTRGRTRDDRRAVRLRRRVAPRRRTSAASSPLTAATRLRCDDGVDARTNRRVERLPDQRRRDADLAANPCVARGALHGTHRTGTSRGPPVRAWWAQSRAEVRMTLRRGETLLLTVGIPVLLLVFFSLDQRRCDTDQESRRFHRAGNPGALRALDVARRALDRDRFRTRVRRTAPSSRDADRHASTYRRKDRRRARDRGLAGHHPRARRAHADVASARRRGRWARGRGAAGPWLRRMRGHRTGARRTPSRRGQSRREQRALPRACCCSRASSCR